MINKEILNKQLNEVCNKWAFSGHFFVLEGQETIYRNRFGKDITDETEFTYDAHESFFLNLILLKLVDNKLIKLTDTLDMYVDNLSLSDQLTIEHLLTSKTGYRDYYYEKLMVDLENDPAHHQLPIEERKSIEAKILYKDRQFEDVIHYLKGATRRAKPGFEHTSPHTTEVLIAKIIEKITETSPLDYLLKEIFKPLGLKARKGTSSTSNKIMYDKTKLIPIEIDFEVDTFFSLKANDFEKFLKVMLNEGLYSKKISKLMRKYDKDENSVFYSPVNGFHCRSSQTLGFECHVYVNIEDKIAFGSIVNEHQTTNYDDGYFNYFRKESREIVTAAMTYPKDTKMVKINKNNYWDALQLKVEQHQNEFVLDPKSSVAMSLVHKEKIGFIQMEGTRAVGLLVLNVDQKNEDFNIDIIIIDKLYQGRGYGKHMVKWAVDYLKEKGAKRLTIGVMRKNIGAKKIYMNAGFKPSSVASGGMELELNL